MTTRFGIVGAGMIAAFHLEALRGIPEVEVTGIMDGGSGKARALAPDLDPAAAATSRPFAPATTSTLSPSPRLLARI